MHQFAMRFLSRGLNLMHWPRRPGKILYNAPYKMQHTKQNSRKTGLACNWKRWKNHRCQSFAILLKNQNVAILFAKHK